MNSGRLSNPFPIRTLGALLALFGLLGAPLQAAKSKFEPVPQPRWNDSSALQPDPNAIGDSTSYAGHADPKNGDTLMWHALDIEGDYLFTATGQGFQSINISNPVAPNTLSYLYGWISGGAFPIWNYSDKDWYIKQIDAPEGDPTVAVLGMEEQGFAIVRNANTAGAVVAYQREQATSRVYAFAAGGGKYAYGQTFGNGSIHLYNLNAAATLNKCHEQPPATTCGGVYMGQVGALETGWSSMAGTGTFLVTGKSGSSGRMKIWNVSIPGAPTAVLEIPGGTPGVALWKVGSSYFAGKIDLTGKQLSVYNVSCIASGSCSGTPSPLWTGTTGNYVMQHLTPSVDGANAYLYVGADDLGTCAPQREYIYDVTNPSSPVELTPKIHADGYWGWYYMGCSTGFNLVGPRQGKVHDNRLYRAAMSILDSHKINKGGPPTANFSWQETEIYPGTPVHFTDQSSGAPAVWMWEFSGGSPATASAQNPTVTFDSAGSKPVTLKVRNAQSEESAPVSQSVTVLDPTPTLGSVTVSPQNPTVCQPITVTGVGGKGAPTLSYDIAVLDSGSSSVAGGVGASNSYIWQTGANTQAGAYTARVTLSNSAGSATKSTIFTLTGLTPLPLPGQFAPTNDAFTSGTVKFHVNIPGATEWAWDFDDDSNPATANFTAFSSDPVNGPNPTHVYTSKGVREVRVKVKNCVTPEVLSAGLAIEITQITPLKALFTFNTANSGGVFFGDTANAVAVLDASTGAELWDYDWNGDGTYEDAGNTTPRTSHLYTATGEFFPKLRVRRGTEEDVYPVAPASVKIIISQGGGGNNNPTISVSGPASGNVNAVLSFSASAAKCSPTPTGNPSGWTWNAPGGTITGGTSASVTISWTSAGNKTVTATNSGCASATGTKSVQINSGDGGGGGVLKAEWSYSPAAPIANQAVSFNGAASTGTPTSYTWDFGDGTGFGVGAQITHTYTAAGNYRVQLTVTKPGNCPPAPFCESSLVKTVVVGTGEAPLLPGFTTNATCISEGGLNVCTGKPNQTLTFDDASQGNPTSWSWNFGDGSTATGKNVTHAFKAGSYNVVLTIGRNGATASFTRTFNIVGDPEPPKSNTVVLPWIAQSRGTLEQSSDLYVHNPGTIPMEIVLEFRKRGLPEVNPPKATRTIQPGATLYVADVLKELFNWENIVGFVTVTRTKGDADPVMTSFNTTYKDGSQFGQTIPGFVFNQEAAPATTGTRTQYLVGLNDNNEREAYFGLTNPNNGPATYKLKFFDALGRPIGTPSAELKLSSYGLKQFQPAEIRSLFGIDTQDDYRVEVETVNGGQIFPYGANVRTASDDPSFLGVGRSSTSKLYLIGSLSTPGLNNSLWQTDVVLANTGTQVALTDVTFTKAGLNDPTAALKVTLQPGETQRLENLIASQWNIKDSVGVVTLVSDSPNDVFPIVQGESYNNANPSMRFGQFMAAFTDADAAGAGKSHYLVGLRQDTNNRTTYWIFNPGTQQAQYDIIYRALDGTELGRINGVLLGGGKLRQFSPSQHALPATGVPGGGFTVQVKVTTGKVLAAAQVVNNQTNDPAYVQGQAQ